ncbi:hypothetical protein HOLleu_11539 [Holothuria leucospilota]|uniref:Uncharacterized protein n=1 Tax=Holothuria leucospilota TaxID=206669 RepID=A0A9Q1CF23_HOLLE|nr:hypothetical protein HOLleu_11539 [Holothuria leucospilota]
MNGRHASLIVFSYVEKCRVHLDTISRGRYLSLAVEQRYLPKVGWRSQDLSHGGRSMWCDRRPAGRV